MNFWVGLLIAVVVVVGIAAASAVWVMTSISRETVSAVTTLGSGNAGRVLMVFHPGLSDFPERTMAAFTDGLVRTGWAIDRTTASHVSPVNVADYDLVVLGSPIYGGAIGKPAADYVARVGDFGGKPVVLVLTGAGETAAALQATEALVSSVNGKVVGRFAYTTMRPNESTKPYEGNNTEIAIQMARDAALAIAPAQ